MAQKSIFEKGDNLEALAIKAKAWFEVNSVSVPNGAAAWQKAAVSRGEIPPGTGVGSLRKYGFNVTTFISHITGDFSKKAYNYSPITADNCENLTGLIAFKFTTLANGHKNVSTRCTQCGTEEVLTYGTLQRMVSAGNKFCRYCRNAGGKRKEVDRYNLFEDFIAIRITEDSRVIYQHKLCGKEIERTMTTALNSEYLVCEHCFPQRNFGARVYTELGYFDSKLEYEAYKILLKYLSPGLIIRQKKYNELFNTGTLHTADFYIPHLNLILEVTSKYNKIGEKYKATAEWKQSLSTNVIFAYSLQEVEDIVRPLVKTSGCTVSHRRSLYSCCPFGRQEATEDF